MNRKFFLVALLLIVACLHSALAQNVVLNLGNGQSFKYNVTEEFGDYFAWGETETKEAYGDMNYIESTSKCKFAAKLGIMFEKGLIWCIEI